MAVTKAQGWTAALMLFVAVGSMPCMALEIPAGGPLDERVKHIDYKSDEVVKVVGHYGFSTHIKLSPTESIENIAMGDTEAWEVAPVNNHLFIKPKADKATTNMTILTNRRDYTFELSAHESQNGAHPTPNDMYFKVEFKYPQDQIARARAEAEANELREKLDQSEEPKPMNWNYWVKGSESVTPSQAFDDGRFTYLSFPNNREMPAVYVENEFGEESLVNTHVKGDTIVVHKIAKRLVLRKGKEVAGIANKSFDSEGIGNPNGTTTPQVKRVIKGE